MHVHDCGDAQHVEERPQGAGLNALRDDLKEQNFATEWEVVLGGDVFSHYHVPSGPYLGSIIISCRGDRIAHHGDPLIGSTTPLGNTVGPTDLAVWVEQRILHRVEHLALLEHLYQTQGVAFLHQQIMTVRDRSSWRNDEDARHFIRGWPVLATSGERGYAAADEYMT
uniref:Uncharacterized protein n=1 Tax=Anopheles atroparvus TaxID=41427 RepID=A0A182JHE9_ANOAO